MNTRLQPTLSAVYLLNWLQINVDDTSAGYPGILYGRYGGDTYAGGNPWVLSTAALAQLLYVRPLHHPHSSSSFREVPSIPSTMVSPVPQP